MLIQMIDGRCMRKRLAWERNLPDGNSVFCKHGSKTPNALTDGRIDLAIHCAFAIADQCDGQAFAQQCCRMEHLH